MLICHQVSSRQQKGIKASRRRFKVIWQNLLAHHFSLFSCRIIALFRLLFLVAESPDDDMPQCGVGTLNT